MKMHKLLLNSSAIFALAALASCSGWRHHDARGRMESPRENAMNVLTKATDAYNQVVRREVPKNVLTKARCVVVLPETGTGAVVVGGSRGHGVATCRTAEGWSSPAFVTMNEASLGVQAGAKRSDLVLFVMDDKAKAALERGRFTIGADASVVAGSFDRNYEYGPNGIVAYERSEGGAFAGAALNGGRITSNDKDTDAFYGRDQSYPALLSGRATPAHNAEVHRFITLLPA